MPLIALQNLAASLAVGTVFTSTVALTNLNAPTDVMLQKEAAPVAADAPAGLKAQLANKAAIAEARTTGLRDLQAWVDKLKDAESQGRTDIKILDVNGRYSYGCLQFQEATFRQYGEQYGLVNKDLSDVEDAIYDCQLQERIATQMILDDYGNWKHWYNSAQKIGLPPRVHSQLSRNTD